MSQIISKIFGSSQNWRFSYDTLYYEIDKIIALRIFKTNYLLGEVELHQFYLLRKTPRTPGMVQENKVLLV